MTFTSLPNEIIGDKSLQAWSEIFLAHMQTLDEQFDTGHRIDHVKRVAKCALEMAVAENASLAIVLPAVMLHDTVPVDKFSADRGRASTLSADHSIQLLTAWNYPAQFYAAISHAIATHSFSAALTPTTLEAKIVQDADRLDALGAIGIARTIAVGSRRGILLYNAEEAFPRTRAADDRSYTLDHFYLKLFRLPQTLHTQTAKDEAARRIKAMENYLQALAQEIGVTYLPFAEYCASQNVV